MGPRSWRTRPTRGRCTSAPAGNVGVLLRREKRARQGRRERRVSEDTQATETAAWRRFAARKTVCMFPVGALMPLFVGCDLGTLGTKVAVVDSAGTIVASAFEEVALRYPKPGWVEQDFDDIEASAHRTIRAALAQTRRVDEVAGVAFSGQMAGVGAIDAGYRPATHYDSWLDTRCEPYIAEMSRHAERITELSGCPPTYSHGPKILWWQREHPQRFRDIERFVVPGAYVAGRLCALNAREAFIDRTYLHFSNLAETEHVRWSQELVEAFGIDEGVLPRIVDPLDIVGEVTRRGAEATGLPPGTPVAAGAGDQAAASLGAAVVRPGQAFDSAGTASVFAMCASSFAPDVSHQTLMATHSVVRDTYITLAFINGGGLALRWFRDELAPEWRDQADAYRRLDELAESVEAGSGRLLWYPHVHGRVLPPQPKARGSWVGLTSAHTRGHLFRSLLEGIAYEYAEWARLASEAAGGAALAHARVLGGGAGSRLWNRIKADVLGIEWVPTLRQECGVLGDALIAAAATGHVRDLAATAEAWQETGDSIRPDAGAHAVYQEMLSAYRELGDQLAPVFENLYPAT
jgi:xylulokinase